MSRVAAVIVAGGRGERAGGFAKSGGIVAVDHRNNDVHGRMTAEALQGESNDGGSGQQAVLFGHASAGALAPSAGYDDSSNPAHFCS